MIYRFISKDGLCQRIGDIDCEALEAKLKVWLDDGAVLATAEEWDQQVMGPLNKRIEELEAASKLPEDEKTEE